MSLVRNPTKVGKKKRRQLEKKGMRGWVKKIGKSLAFSRVRFIAPQASPARPVLATINYRDLWSSNYWDEECWKCRHSPNVAKPMLTDVGKMNVVECSECGQLMRPYRS